MYIQGSSEFNTIIETPNNQALIKRLVLTDDDTEIENILSITSDSSSSQNELQIGTTNMSYIEVTAVTDKILTNREVRLECGVKLSDGTIEYAPMGIYTIQKPKGDIDKITFKANDKMQKFEKPYISSLSYPTTSDKVLEELCTMCGVELATPIDTPIAIAEKLDGYTCREILGYIAGIHTKFACFDRLGKLNLRWYSNTPIEKKIGLIYEFSKAENNFTVSKIELAKDAETKYTSGSGFGIVYHSNPLATQEIADSIFNSLNGFTYNATSLNILDDIRLDLGDIVKVEYLDGIEYLVPCMSLKQDFTQGSTSIEAYSKTDEENEYRYTGPTTKYIERVAHELLLANRIIATKVDAEYVNSHAITTDNLDAITANITNLVVERIDGQYADIHLANIDIADIGKLFADVGLITSANIVNGHITGYLDAVEINANKITAGTLSVDRLIFRGGENSIIYELNNITGALQAVQGDTLNGEIITDRSITVDKIVAKSITANEIASETITGNEIVAKSLTSIQIDVEDLFAQNIVANGTITGAKLYGTYAEVNSGKIGGFDISNGKITITNKVYINPTYKECELVRAYNLGTGTLTPQQLSASDINKDGVVDLQDALMMRNLLLNKATIYSYQSNPTLSDVTFTINPADANKTIEFKGVNSWGEAIDNYIGINAIKTSSLTTDGLVFKDCDGEKLEVTSVLKAPRIEFGTNYEFGLDDLGQVWASNVYLGNTKSIFCHNSEGNPISAVMMASYDVLHLGYDASGIMIGNHGLTNDASIYVDNEITLNAPKVRIGEYNTAGQTSTGVALWSSGAVTIAGSVPELAFRYNNSAAITSSIYESSQGTLTSTAKFRAPSIEFGSNYGYGLDPLGQVWASNIYVSNGSACYVFNSSGTAINSIYMDTSNILRFGYGASDVWIGNHGTTNRTMIYGTRIDFCANTAGTSETNPAISLVSSAGGANLTLRPTTVNAVATYLGDSTYYFNTIYYATLSQISDRTTKKDIYDISEKYLELWDKLSVKTFRYIDDDKTIKVGLIAQEVEECAYKVGLTNEECGFILKEYVDNEIHKGYRYSLDYTGLATITMARLKKTIEIVTEHDKRIQDLEDEIAILKATINHLQAQYA